MVARVAAVTDTEASRVLAKMAATWPQKELTKPEKGEWHDVLHHFDYPIAIKAVEQLRTAHDWLPTHRQFTDCAAGLVRRARMDTPALPAPANERYREIGKAHIKELRALLKASR